MTWKRLVTALVLLGVQAALGPVILAQEPGPASGEEPDEAQGTVDAPLAEVPEEQKKFPFALYLEAAAGLSEADEINSTIYSQSSDFSTNLLNLTDNVFGRAVVGWKLTEGRGRFLARFEGFKEDSYEFSAVGEQAAVTPRPSGGLTGTYVWWTLRAENGRFTSQLTPPVWTDSNGDLMADPSEVSYAPDPTLTITGAAPKDLQNRMQTFDIVYERDFGGRRTSARWGAGLRYFVYEGNIPAGAWLNLIFSGAGFTDGGLLHPLTLAQDTSAFGPTGSVEIQQHFLRDRIVLYGQARAAFLVESLEVDSGRFLTLIWDDSQTTYVPVQARIDRSLDKSVWHTGAELGARFRLAKGFHLHAAFAIVGYQDALLLPTRIVLPLNLGQADVGITAVYKTKDIVQTGWFTGVSFQF